MNRIVNEIFGDELPNYRAESNLQIASLAKTIFSALERSSLISSKELRNAVDLDNSDTRIKLNAQLLLSAINDYPYLNFKEPVEFLNVLKNEIGYPLTSDTIENYNRQILISEKGNAWKMESLASVLEMFNKSKSTTLDEIVEEISKHYKLQMDSKIYKNCY